MIMQPPYSHLVSRRFFPATYMHTGVHKGMVSEFLYRENRPVCTQDFLPLLQNLSTQARWLLWLLPQQKLNRNWLRHSGLPLDKIIQVNHISPEATVEAMEKALQTGNYSAVLGWLPEVTTTDWRKLHLAAQQGDTLGFIMRNVRNPGLCQ